MIKKHMKQSDQSGFTIVELMIATAVLSVLLLLSTSVILGVGNLYNKGVNQSRTQDDARSIIDEVTQHLQLNASKGSITTAAGTGADAGESAYCIGTTRYTYVLGQQLDGGGTHKATYGHVLWRDTVPGTGCAVADFTDANLATDTQGTELIATRTRLVQFNISTTSPYSLQVAVAYGDDDLLCDPSDTTNPNTCTDPAVMPDADFSNGNLLVCKSAAGDEYCAVASLDTSVSERL
jgi:prepilin-type N-terminal cleavage/methylation domain-containing protein